MQGVPSKSPLYEATRSPLYELRGGTMQFLEESQILQASSNAVVLVDPPGSGLNFTEQDPSATISAAQAKSWSVFGSAQPYQNPALADMTAINSGGRGVYNWQSDVYAYVSGNAGIKRIFPNLPKTISNTPWQSLCSQFAVWMYDPSYQGYPSPDTWNNSVYVQRCRFRCNQPVTAWVAAGSLYNAFTADGIHWTTYDYTGGIIYGLMFGGNKASIIQQPQTLNANTWLELPKPSGGPMPSRNSGFCGQMVFAVYAETPAQWSARTGIQTS